MAPFGCRFVPAASVVRRLGMGIVDRLGPAARLPGFEMLLSRLARAPRPDRQHLLEATRRVMIADGQVRPVVHEVLPLSQIGPHVLARLSAHGRVTRV